MKDRLPRMSIRIDTTPEEFLRRIKALALQIGEFIVESERDPAGGDQVATLRLKPILVTQHRELAGHIIVIPASPDRVTVEVHASHWQPDPPTYRAYAAAAREIFKPLLHQYNRKFHGTTCTACWSAPASPSSTPLTWPTSSSMGARCTSGVGRTRREGIDEC